MREQGGNTYTINNEGKIINLAQGNIEIGSQTNYL